jgi:DNA helicase-2/ATP-dependent DNA helicase PcrA
MIEVTNRDIEYAESILLPKGKRFNAERRDFIRNLSTADLQAVPGSGKTTVLLAKLIILERKMPFSDTEGVLVLSHTNSAVDEIKSRLGGVAPKLFEYPNFIGTIQSFVDRFLAIPYYTRLFGKKPVRIDNDIYFEKSKYLYYSLKNGTKTYLKKKKGRDDSPEQLFFSIRIDTDKNLIRGGINGSIFLKSGSESESYSDIKEKKKILMRDWGYLCYDDAYALAKLYIRKNPVIIKSIQKRFRFVFVDEMQDMDKHQVELLEKLFYKKHVLRHCFQRIGDINQAIHNNVTSEDCWKPRNPTYKIRESHRLSKPISLAVQYFGLNSPELTGVNSDADTRPILIPYDNSGDVLSEFSTVIQEHNLQPPRKMKYPYRAIGWVSDFKLYSKSDAKKDPSKREGQINPDKKVIKSFHADFEKTKNNPKIDYDSMKDYLICFKISSNCLNPIRKNILHIFTKVLRLEGIRKDNGRSYTTMDLWNKLKQEDSNYETFKSNLYNWCISVKNRDADFLDLFEDLVVTFFEERKELFNIDPILTNSQEFLNLPPQFSPSMATSSSSEEENIYTSENGVKIKLGTIHSVKGETHMATLYMETFYEKGESYESLRLLPQFKKEGVLTSQKYLSSTENQKELIEQSAKMTYVGLSRPTHLLCFAIHKSRFDETKIDKDIWDIRRNLIQ